MFLPVKQTHFVAREGHFTLYASHTSIVFRTVDPSTISPGDHSPRYRSKLAASVVPGRWLNITKPPGALFGFPCKPQESLSRLRINRLNIVLLF